MFNGQNCYQHEGYLFCVGRLFWDVFIKDIQKSIWNFLGLNFAGFARSSSSSQKFIAAYQPFFLWLLWQHEIYLWKLVVANQFIASKLQNNVIANKCWFTVYIFLPPPFHPPSNLHLHPPHSVSMQWAPSLMFRRKAKLHQIFTHILFNNENFHFDIDSFKILHYKIEWLMQTSCMKFKQNIYVKESASTFIMLLFQLLW